MSGNGDEVAETDGSGASRDRDSVAAAHGDRNSAEFPVLLEARDATGDLLRRYEHDGFRYTRVHHADGRSQVLLTDHIGTVRGVVDNGAFTPINYDAFGGLTTELGADLDIGFAGGLLDQATGLTYFASRWYDPTTARFTQVDSDPGSIADTRTFNRYVYAFGDPVNRLDPLGQLSLSEAVAVSGVLSALVAGYAVAVPNSGLTSALTQGRTNFLPENRSGTTRPFFEITRSPDAGTLGQGGGSNQVRSLSLTSGFSLSGGLEVLDVGAQALFGYLGVGLGAGITAAGNIDGSTDEPTTGGPGRLEEVSGAVRGAVGDVFDTPINNDYNGLFVSFTAGASLSIGIRTPIGSGGISRGLVRTIAYSPVPGSTNRFSHSLTDFRGGVPFGGARGDLQASASVSIRGGIGISFYFEILVF